MNGPLIRHGVQDQASSSGSRPGAPGDQRDGTRVRSKWVDQKPRISVIVPARNEQEYLGATLAAAVAESGVELIVVDGQSSDRTAAIARGLGATVVSASPSRGRQLNVGAARARADVLLFLHADTMLPPDFVDVVMRTLEDPGTSAGAFRLRIDRAGWALRIIEWGVCQRSRLRGRPYGDQAMFMTRDTFDACGGFPDLPHMEDYGMLSRLHAQGRVRLAEASVVTSARRWQRDGAARTTFRNQWLIMRYCLRSAIHKQGRRLGRAGRRLGWLTTLAVSVRGR